MFDHQNASQICYGHIWYYATEKLYTSFLPPPSTTPEIHCIMVHLLCVSGYIFPLTIPNSRKLGPQFELSTHQVFPMPFNSCMLSTANFSLYITWWGWRQSSLNAITTIISDPEKRYVYSLLLSDQSKTGSYLGPALWWPLLWLCPSLLYGTSKG